MEENNNNENFSVDKEQLKNETKDTVNQVRETIKNTDFKEEAVQTKGFLMDMFLKPVETVRRVASGEESVLSKAIVILVVYMIASAVQSLVSQLRFGSLKNIFGNIVSIIGAAINPLLLVLVPAILILILNRKNKKSMITIISTIVIAFVPRVLSQIVSILSTLTSKLYFITSPVTTLCSAISFVLVYFGMKELFAEEEDNSFIKTFAIIEVLSAFIMYVINSL